MFLESPVCPWGKNRTWSSTAFWRGGACVCYLSFSTYWTARCSDWLCLYVNMQPQAIFRKRGICLLRMGAAFNLRSEMIQKERHSYFLSAIVGHARRKDWNWLDTHSWKEISLVKEHAFVQYYEGNHISERTRSCHSGPLWLARYDLYARNSYFWKNVGRSASIKFCRSHAHADAVSSSPHAQQETKDFFWY